MSRHMDRDGIYERQLEDGEIEEPMPEPPAQRPQAPQIDYYPQDDDEIGAVEHYVDLYLDGVMDEQECESAYRSYVRRHRRGGEW